MRERKLRLCTKVGHFPVAAAQLQLEELRSATRVGRAVPQLLGFEFLLVGLGKEALRGAEDAGDNRVPAVAGARH